MASRQAEPVYYKHSAAHCDASRYLPPEVADRVAEHIVQTVHADTDAALCTGIS